MPTDDTPKKSRRTQSRTTPDTAARESHALTGPKLTPAQRRTLLLLIATYWETDTVARIIAAEYPDWPTVTDETIRYHRRQLDTYLTAAREKLTGEPTEAQREVIELAAAVQTARDAVLERGLASKAVRIGQLEQLYLRLSRSLIDRQEKIERPGQDPLYVDIINPHIAREMRGTLEQIAKETGGYVSDTPSAPGVTILNAPGGTVAVASTPGEAKALLADAMQRIEERRLAMQSAEDGLPG